MHSDSTEIVCHKCRIETAHERLHDEKKTGNYSLDSDYDHQESGWWQVHSEVFKCLGCRELTIRRTTDGSEADYPNVDFYPPRETPSMRPVPQWVEKLPDGMDDLVRETYQALNQFSYRLVAMGLRAIMEALMNEKVKDIGGFEQKVEAMCKQGFLSETQRLVVEPTLELGHAAIHRGHRPNHGQIEAAVGVVESLLHLFYVQATVVKKLKDGVKPRKRRKKAAKKPPSPESEKK